MSQPTARRDGGPTRFAVTAAEIAPGLEFRTKTRGYRVVRVLAGPDEVGGGWHITEVEKTDGAYAGNRTTLFLRTENHA
jgi:hypothetical protein